MNKLITFKVEDVTKYRNGRDELKITASTQHGGKGYSVEIEGRLDEFTKLKKKAVRELEREINYSLFLKERSLKVEEVTGRSVEEHEITIAY